MQEGHTKFCSQNPSLLTALLSSFREHFSAQINERFLKNRLNFTHMCKTKHITYVHEIFNSYK